MVVQNSLQYTTFNEKISNFKVFYLYLTFRLSEYNIPRILGSKKCDPKISYIVYFDFGKNCKKLSENITFNVLKISVR